MPVIAGREQQTGKRTPNCIWGSGIFLVILLVSILVIPCVRPLDFHLGNSEVRVWGELSYVEPKPPPPGAHKIEVPVPPGFWHFGGGPPGDFWSFRIGSCAFCVLQRELPR